MKAVTTIALLSKKQGISTSLFSKYWRDVHGILAARIPGFDSYTQYHLGPAIRNMPLPKYVVSAIPANLRVHGIAEVTFADDIARAGLASSEVAAMIRNDEQNVFKTSLLYNLEPGASHTYLEKPTSDSACSYFILLGRSTQASANALIAATEQYLLPALAQQPGISRVRMHRLSSGDPTLWNTAGVDNQLTPDTAFEAVIQITSTTLQEIENACACTSLIFFDSVGKLHFYPAKARHVMVEHGRPSHLGLRGLDALQTIIAAGASNQLEDALVHSIYGISPR
ncbi:EthD domain-containing protein [Pseudomonas baetica]|uniref:EthD domain-containing protein n=1 Tax=Pseudomonas baetica TaxID=674054 RepID=UPI002406FC0E|nr:EthD domain-containing protein [Pseudomonas baetica]MDF9773284.1 hypothetical protein [Pseudomonas baetica]